MSEENIYQAIGVIVGKVSIETEENKELLYIHIKNKNEEKKYRVFYSKKKYRSFEALKLELKNSNNRLKLIVYPKLIHFPEKDKPYFLAFQLVGFSPIKSKTNRGVIEQLEDNTFILNGKWQFIPACRTPVITIHKNYSPERVDYFKSLETIGKRKLAKATHVPVYWNNAIVDPFKFNPKLTKEEQGKLYFVKIKARFLPDKDAFGFDSLMGIPTKDIPRFMKFKVKKKSKLLESKQSKDKVKEPVN